MNLLSYSSEGQTSDRGPTGLKSRCGRTAFLSEGSGGEHFSCVVQLPEAAHIPWPVAPFFDLESRQRS